MHLTSAQFDAVAQAKAAGLFTVISAHSPVEVMHAAAEGADAVTRLFKAGSSALPTVMPSRLIWFLRSCRLLAVVAARASYSRCIEPA